MRFLRPSWRLLAAFIVLLVASACSTATSQPTDNPGQAGRGTFLYAAPDEAMFIDWTAEIDRFKGTVDWRRKGSEPVKVGFTATANGSNLSFSFEPGPIASWTGRFEGSGLVLLVPDSGGNLKDIAFRSATEEEFKGIVEKMR